MKKAIVKEDGTVEISCYYAKPVVHSGDTFKIKNNRRVSLLYAVTSTKASTVSVKGVSGKVSGSLSAPNTVKIFGKTYKVTKTSSLAFANHKKLTRIRFGSNMTSIGSKPFLNDSKLALVTLGKKISKTGDSAFSSAKKLKPITVKSKKFGSKKAFEDSSVKTVKVKVCSKAANKMHVKKYRRVFTKKFSGKKVTAK